MVNRRTYLSPEYVCLLVFLGSLCFPSVLLGAADGQYCELVLKCRKGRKAGRNRGNNGTVDIPEELRLTTKSPSLVDEDLVRTLQELGRNNTAEFDEEDEEDEYYEEEEEEEEEIDPYEEELEEELEESFENKETKNNEKEDNISEDLEEEIENLKPNHGGVDNLEYLLSNSSSGAVDYDDEETVLVSNASYFDAEDMLEYMQYHPNLTGESLELTASSKERYFNFSVGESVESTESSMEDDYLIEYYNSSANISHNASINNAGKTYKEQNGDEAQNSVLDPDEDYTTLDGDYSGSNSTNNESGDRRLGKGGKGRGQKAAKGRAKLSSGYKHCNKTIKGLKEELLTSDGKKMTLRMPKILKPDRGTPFYCWYRFEGSEKQGVQVTVNDVRAGSYDEIRKDCMEGFLRISDKESCSTDPEWLPPTTLCGHYEQGSLRVKRITRTPSAFVEFRLEKARSSKGYEFDVAFIDKDTESEGKEEEELPFGHLQRQEGRIANTKCNWLIPVDSCIGYCQVVSPGYPGIYPPNTRCRYMFTNFEDSRVELMLGGTRFNGKFDMKKSENCTEDYVEVYDGMSTINPLIGRYCGHEGEHIISSGSSLLLIFESGPGGPPWDYSGFDARVTDRWRDHHEGGHKIPNSVCDWLFESSDSPEGDLHTPDHILKDVTSCTYQFKGEPGGHMTLEIVVEKLLPNCTEYLEILDGPQVLDTICSDRILRPRLEFRYNTTTSSAIVRYVSTRGQTSNPQPSWIYYTFISPPPTTSTTSTTTSVSEVEFSLELGVSEARSRIEESYEDSQDVDIVETIHMDEVNPKVAETKSQAVAGSTNRGSQCSTPNIALLLFIVFSGTVAPSIFK